MYEWQQYSQDRWRLPGLNAANFAQIWAAGNAIVPKAAEWIVSHIRSLLTSLDGRMDSP